MLNKIIGLIIVIFNGLWAFQSGKFLLANRSEGISNLEGSLVNLWLFLICALIGVGIGLGVFSGRLAPRKWGVIALLLVTASVLLQQFF